MLQDFKDTQIPIVRLMSYGSKIYGRYFKYILLLALIVFVPLNILGSLLPAVSMAELQEMILAGNVTSNFKYLSLSVGLNIIYQPLAVAGATYIAGQDIENKSVAADGLLGATISKWGKHVLTAMLYFSILIPTAILIIPAIYYGFIFYMFTNIVAVTGKFGFAALRESAAIIKGRFWASMLFVIIINVLETSTIWIIDIALAVLGISSSLPVALKIVILIIYNVVGLYFQIVMALRFFNLKLLAQHNNVTQ